MPPEVIARTRALARTRRLARIGAAPFRGHAEFTQYEGNCEVVVVVVIEVRN
jgi:hypothetical protein